MINWNVFPTHILPRLQSHNLMKDLRRQPRLVTDTSDFTSIDCGDVILVDNRYFLVVGYTKEGRFGIDDQPKLWVPKVVDLENGDDSLEDPDLGEKVLKALHVDDLALLSRDRIFNLRKLKPDLPKCFNDILLHFSVGTPVLYDEVEELYDDLSGCMTEVYG